MAYNGFFNIEVTPTLTGQNCVTAFGNGDVVCILYTSNAYDDTHYNDLSGPRINKKKY